MLLTLAAWLCWAGAASAQSVSQKGFLELRATAYPQEAESDTTRLLGETLFRYEASARPVPWLSLAGSVELRADTHEQTAASWRVDWDDRGTQRPRVGIRTLSANVSRGPVSLEFGKQFVRWGKADVLNPTDRFAPRDYLNVVDSEVFAVSGARALIGLESDSLDVVYVPRLTPSRTPIPGQRWALTATLPDGVSVIDAGRTIPADGQMGARWNHVGKGFEFSLSGYRGVNHTPAVEQLATIQVYPPVLAFAQFYPKLWTLGGDVAVPMSLVTLKAEAAFFGTDDERVDQYWIYVIQLERQAGEWFFVGGYSGEVVTEQRQVLTFAPERGLTKAFVGKAGYTIDANRSVSFEGAIRQNLNGSWMRAEYSHASGQHLRFTVRGNWIRGNADDFLGRYRRNSNLTATLRYSF